VIIVDNKGLMTLITQPDHARFAGELLALWRTDGLPEHPRRQELLFATREHDNGWREADSAPWIDPETRRPYDFIGYPAPDRLELWQRGIFRFADRRPMVALLIAEHAEAIHRPQSEDWLRFFEVLEPHRHTWLEQAGVDRSIVRQDYSFLGLADALSLALCTRGTERLERPGINATVTGDLLQLDPFPLAGTTTFQIPVRRIDNQPYDSDTQIGSALARARWERWQVKVGPKTSDNA